MPLSVAAIQCFTEGECRLRHQDLDTLRRYLDLVNFILLLMKMTFYFVLINRWVECQICQNCLPFLAHG